MPGETTIVLRLLLASVLGGLIGLGRQVHGREAGVRTYLLVCLGSALIMVISESLFFQYRNLSPDAFPRADPGRIAAQAITGIGFLGAGVIIRYGNSIRGLTTAACMWVTCAAGLAVGAGYYLYGGVVSAITLFSLVGLKRMEKRWPSDWYRALRWSSEERVGSSRGCRRLSRGMGSPSRVFRSGTTATPGNR
jgi:putative Mg2+ transporter-C (MgtC) family protein